MPSKHSLQAKLTVLLAGAFLLEMAGYVAFPYISLRLRNSFNLDEEAIGLYFLLAIWLRPVWSILGGLLAEKIRPVHILSMACLSETIGFLLLAFGTHPYEAVLALVIGNLGLSLWSPNLFALIYKWYDDKQAVSKVSVLSGISNSGAVIGCLLGAWLSSTAAQPIFLSAAALYLVAAPVLGYVLRHEMPSKSEAISDSQPIPAIFRSNLKAVALILAISIGFWASYGQFNAFFALFSHDWLHRDSITGIAFGGVAVGVTIFSLVLSRLRDLKHQLKALSASGAFAFSIAWLILVSFPNYFSVMLFVAAISWAESCFSIYLADLWSDVSRGRTHFMQAMNYAFRNVGMGLGSLIGGIFYHSQSVMSPSLMGWGLSNMVLLAVAAAALVLLVTPIKNVGANG